MSKKMWAGKVVQAEADLRNAQLESRQLWLDWQRAENIVRKAQLRLERVRLQEPNEKES